MNDPQAIIEAAGGIYLGYFVDEKRGCMLHTFRDPETGSTLAISDQAAVEGGVQVVANRMKASRIEFAVARDREHRTGELR